MSLPNHGANPLYLTQALGMDHPDKVIDFSVNTNPFGPPTSLRDYLQEDITETVATYPDPHATKLKAEIATSIGVDPAMILIGNGAAELIFLIANVFSGKKVTIVEPAFSEYRDACEAYDCAVRRIILPPPWELRLVDIESCLKETDLLFLCTPNNPTGVSYDSNEVIELIKAAKATNTQIVIDEAFFDFTQAQENFIDEVKSYSNLLVLRSLTKMYAIAGVRLGYAVATPTLIKQMEKRQPPWSVNGMAQKIGTRLMQESSFVENTVKKITKERQRVTETLRSLGFQVSNSSVNFFLLSENDRKNLDQLLRFLIERGIIPRHTYNFNGLDGNYLRFAIKDYKHNQALLTALKEWRYR